MRRLKWRCMPRSNRGKRQGSNRTRLGHLMLRWRTCSAEDRRDTRFYDPPRRAGSNPPHSGWPAEHFDDTIGRVDGKAPMMLLYEK